MNPAREAVVQYIQEHRNEPGVLINELRGVRDFFRRGIEHSWEYMTGTPYINGKNTFPKEQPTNQFIKDLKYEAPGAFVTGKIGGFAYFGQQYLDEGIAEVIVAGTAGSWATAIGLGALVLTERHFRRTYPQVARTYLYLHDIANSVIPKA